MGQIHRNLAADAKRRSEDILGINTIYSLTSRMLVFLSRDGGFFAGPDARVTAQGRT